MATALNHACTVMDVTPNEFIRSDCIAWKKHKLFTSRSLLYNRTVVYAWSLPGA
jgi:hypothetical protein